MQWQLGKMDSWNSEQANSVVQAYSSNDIVKTEMNLDWVIVDVASGNLPLSLTPRSQPLELWSAGNPVSVTARAPAGAPRTALIET